MLEQVYRTGLLGVAVVLVGGVLYAAWGRWFGGERSATQAEAEERSVNEAEPKERPVIRAEAEERSVIRAEAAPEERPVIRAEAAPEERPVIRAEAAPEERPVIRAEAAPEERPVIRAEAAPEERPVIRAEASVNEVKVRPVIQAEERSGIQAEEEENAKHILVVGLDGAGKTSFLHSLSTSTVKRSDGPTKMFNSVCVKIEDAEIKFLEIGGGESPRQCWSSHLSGSQALVYVVDSADHNRMPLAKRELHQLVQGDTKLPVVVLANKQDIKGACTILEIHEKLSLDELGDERKLFLIGTHVAENGSQIPTSVQDAKELIAQLVIC